MFIRQANGRDLEAVNVKSIGCGAFHSLVVITPHVYSCGLNNYGQVSSPLPFPSLPSPDGASLQLGIDSLDSQSRLVSIEGLEGLGVITVAGGQ
jgi:hypothetical protein